MRFCLANALKIKKQKNVIGHKCSVILVLKSQCEKDAAWARHFHHNLCRLRAFFERHTIKIPGALKRWHRKKPLQMRKTDVPHSRGTLAYGYKVATVISGFEDLVDMIKAREFWKFPPEDAFEEELLPLIRHEDTEGGLSGDLYDSGATSSLQRYSFTYLSAQIFLLLNVNQSNGNFQYQNLCVSKDKTSLIQTPLKLEPSKGTSTVPQDGLSVFLESLTCTLPILEVARIVKIETPQHAKVAAYHDALQY